MTEDTLADQAYRAIKRRILTGELSARIVLTERILAEQSDISRTPLRAAIQRLEKEGVIARLSNGTLTVREVTLEQLMEISEVRRILEGAAAAEAARRADGGLHPALAAARQAMRGYAGAQDAAFDAFWEEDEAFHRAVAVAAGFALLPELLRELRETARRCTISRTQDLFAEQAAEHLAVIDAIEAGDPARARTAMEAHFDNVRQRFLARLMRRPGAPPDERGQPNM
ncbi:GntR family transcriptional regulator [Paenirhodobacter populi]|uniref:GntR family transcriptional regulator n=1 Tax=Paenirhodobacter populi TaxID=2306993 RepID=A0A443INQ2_9RHOB|nr:GntR family transcriptional regulator [Sinirhodobacter populi]RWR07243.1 GntR family transcriptional regulator [Sinirhodobacter populi]RWR19246.1 GntR family transcriptional regulator [Sinirhodobacter populi]